MSSLLNLFFTAKISRKYFLLSRFRFRFDHDVRRISCTIVPKSFKGGIIFCLNPLVYHFVSIQNLNFYKNLIYKVLQVQLHIQNTCHSKKKEIYSFEKQTFDYYSLMLCSQDKNLIRQI